MLSVDDADLLSRDRSLPGLPVLLDEERFRERLAAARPSLPIGRVRAHYLRWRPPTSCLVAYRVQLGDEELALHAVTWGRLDRAKLDEAERKPYVAGPLGRRLLRWEDVPAAAWSFPNDAALDALGAANVAAERRGLVARLSAELAAPERGELERAVLERLAYRPARRYVGALVAASGRRSVLRLYSRGEWLRRARVARPARRRGRGGAPPAARIPLEIGSSEGDRTALVEWLPGSPLRDLLDGPELPRAALEAAGCSLAALHRAGAPSRARMATAREERPGRIAVTLGALAPERADAVATLARQLETELDRVARADPPVPSHGDLHAKQFVVDVSGGVGLLDLDGFALAPPAEDLGNFWSHLERDAVLGRLPESRADDAAAALLDGYRRGGGTLPSARDLAAHRALGLLRLAGHSFRDREPEWRERVGIVIDRAGAALRSNGDGP